MIPLYYRLTLFLWSHSCVDFSMFSKWAGFMVAMTWWSAGRRDDLVCNVKSDPERKLAMHSTKMSFTETDFPRVFLLFSPFSCEGQKIDAICQNYRTNLRRRSTYLLMLFVKKHHKRENLSSLFRCRMTLIDWCGLATITIRKLFPLEILVTTYR